MCRYRLRCRRRGLLLALSRGVLGVEPHHLAGVQNGPQVGVRLVARESRTTGHVEFDAASLHSAECALEACAARSVIEADPVRVALVWPETGADRVRSHLSERRRDGANDALGVGQRQLIFA